MLNMTRISLLSVLMVMGCQMASPIQRVRNSEPEAQSTAPLVIDGAMQLRDWERSTAMYSNGDTVAGPTGFPYEARWYMPEPVYPLVETPLFVGQTVLMPVTLTITPPWTPIRYSGATVETTYTAMPQLPGTPNP